MPQTLTDIKALLAAHGLRPKHHLGQHFLHDGNQMERIVNAACIEPCDLVLEVGAGTGALSMRLLESAARLVAVELDADLKPILLSQFQPYGQATILVQADVLRSKHQINPLVLDALCAMGSDLPTEDLPPFKLVANLPYDIASPLLAMMATSCVPMGHAVVTVQREVADRLTAAVGGKAYGPLTVCIQAMCYVEQIAVVSPSCFWPQPQVESSIVCLRRRESPLTDCPEALKQTVRHLFGHRRKQLKTILRRHFPGHAVPDDLNPMARPEQLTVEQWIRLSRCLY